MCWRLNQDSTLEYEAESWKDGCEAYAALLLHLWHERERGCEEESRIDCFYIGWTWSDHHVVSGRIAKKRQEKELT
jgi:hypothetical protein